MGILAHGVRLVTELRPRMVLVNLDVENAHNSLKRCVALQRLASVRGLRHLVPAYWAIYGPKSRIYFRGRNREVIRAGFDSEEAWRQGCPLAQLGFNVAILPEVQWLDAQLARHRGSPVSTTTMATRSVPRTSSSTSSRSSRRSSTRSGCG